jgi:peroxiredoxin
MNQVIGQKFPDFELPDQDGQPVKLSELIGKFPLILTFYRGYW